MSTSHKPAIFAPTSTKGGHQLPDSTSRKSDAPRQSFIAMAVTMSWQLAVVVLVPIIGGVKLDKAVGKSYVFTLLGLALAVVGSGLVMRQAFKTANQLPVPKLTDAERRAVQKSYDEDDE